MSREVRRVPSNWEHPKNKKGKFIPLHDNYERDVMEWEECKAKWDDGFVEDFKNGGWRERTDNCVSFEEWYGRRPEEREYMPNWDPEECTHLMMYETCSEGTPISPAFKTPEELARWLADNEASAFGGRTASYESWLATIKDGWAISAVYSQKHGLISGVESTGIEDEK